MSTYTPDHQGGVMGEAGTQERRVAASIAAPPAQRSDTGGKGDNEPPAELMLPHARQITAPEEPFPQKWMRAIIGRNGSPEEMVHEALNRVSQRHSEERLLEARAVINELGRSTDHTKMLRSVLTADRIKSFLQKKR
jgi:hypothetical protein